MSAAPPSANGFSQVIDGVSASSGLSPVTARYSATAAKISSDTTWARISTFCRRAEASVPITQSAVITRMTSTVSDDHHRRALGQLVQAEGAQPEPDGHVGQRADDQHAGHRDGPAADPAQPRPHRPGDPGEGGAAVRVDAVQVVEGRRDQQHRHERGQQHARRVHPDQGDERADDRGQRVRGRGGGQADRPARRRSRWRRASAPAPRRGAAGGRGWNRRDRRVRCSSRSLWQHVRFVHKHCEVTVWPPNATIASSQAGVRNSWASS